MLTKGMKVSEEANNTLTKNRIDCACCGNLSVMRIICQGDYVVLEGDDIPDYPENSTLRYQVLMCLSCKGININHIVFDNDGGSVLLEEITLPRSQLQGPQFYNAPDTAKAQISLALVQSARIS